MTENPPGDQGPLSKNPGNSGGGFPPPGNYPPPPPSGGGFPPPGNPPGGYPPPPPGGGYPPPPPGGSYPPPPGGSYPPPGGSYPPPPGNYPPPPPGGGGFPPGGGYPPPPGNYPPQGGGYPPPPPGGGYMPGGGGVFSVGNALRFGWNRFKENPGIWIGVAVLMYLVSALLNAPFGNFNVSVNDSSYSSTSFADNFGILSIIGILVSSITGYLIQAVFVRGALGEADRRKPGFGDFFQIPNIGQVLIAGLLVSVVTFVGIILCIIPGLIFAFLAMFTFYFVIDQGQDAVTAVKSSINLVKANVGPLLLLVLALIGINILGLCACLVGLLVTGPVSIIATAYAYRTLIGREPAIL